MEARQFAGGKCTFNMEQFKGTEELPAYFTGESLDGTGEQIGFYKQDFLGGGYPVVIRGFPEFLLVVKDQEDDDDTAPVEFQYFCQKWKSDSKQCEQTEYTGESRNISCTFDC